MSKAKIFYLDDEPELLDFVSFILKRYDYDVITGERWEDVYLEQLKEVDLILLDIMFPEEDFTGYDICTKIRSEESLKDVPVYMFSAKCFKEDKDEAIRRGANGFIEKPIAVEQLLNIVEKVTQER